MALLSRPVDRPTVTSRNLSLAYCLVLLLVAAAGSGWALGSAVAGVGSIGIGFFRCARRWVSVGLWWFVTSALFLALEPGPVEPVVLVTLLGVLAWDAGQRAIETGVQLGREGSTARLERVHAGSSAVVGVGVASIGYSAYVVSGRGLLFPTAAVLLVGVAGFTLWATR